MTKHDASLDRVLRALSDPTRRAVLERLGRKPVAVSELAAPFRMALPSFVHAQKINDGFFSAIARIDVDRRPGSVEPNPGVALYAVVPLYSGVAAYAIPADNPFIGATNFNGVTISSNTVRTGS